ncbi:MAG: MFS transporter [Candidatus Omnitrophica bacterium]|nr:MFS transporter [Candidatus Omnitrophota bacterium]MBU4589619.1 MFS transporter [Candidatus Omnitrophota bacterium]
MTSVRGLLKDKNFSLLWFSQIISNFGDRLDQMALIGLIYARAPGSTFELAKLLSFTIIPVFLIGPIAGIYVDRWDRKRTMIFCDLLRGVLVLLIPLAIIYSSNMVPIYVIVFIVFSATRFFLPSKLAIIPDIVHKDRLLLANSLTSTTMMIATIIGFGFGGIIVAQVGAKGGFCVDSATYFISAVMMSFVVLGFKEAMKTKAPKEKLRKIIRKTVLGDIKEGLLYLKDHKDIRMVANTMFLLMAGVGSVYVIIIVFVQEVLGSSTSHLGFLAMFLGAGLFLGSVVYGRFGGKMCKRKVINSGLFISGLIIVVFSMGLLWWPYFYVAAIVSMVLGMFAAPIVVSSNTLLHEVMKAEMRGRIFSSLDVIMHIAFLVFMVLTSIIAEWVGKGAILITIGLMLSAIGLMKLKLTK